MLICPRCGSQHRDHVKFCNICGNSLEPQAKQFCPQCGFEVHREGAKFCKACGLQFDEDHSPVVRMVDNMQKICPHCGSLLQNGNAKFCKICGVQFSEDKRPLPLSDDAKYYRVCVKCGLPYDLASGITVCKRCGAPLDLTPRLTPELTPEEMIAVQERQEKELKMREEQEAAERKRREEERIMQEAAEKERLEREAEIKQRKAKARKTTFKVLLGVTLLALVLVFAGHAIWQHIDKTNMKKAEEALLVNDYDTALQLYGKVSSKSKFYTQAQDRSAQIQNAVDCYNDAETKYNKPAYLDAMAACKEAETYETGMPMINELYTKAQDDLAKYIEKLINEENYKNALAVIKKVGEDDKNDAINNAETTINNRIKQYYDDGNKLLEEGSLDAALENLNAAINITTEYKDATNLKTKLAEAFTVQANAQFDAGSMDGALQFVEKAQDADSSYSGIGEVKSKVAGYYATAALNAFNAVNMTDAINYADQALSIDSSNSDASNVKTNAQNYNKYVETLNRAGGQYSRWEIYDAYETLSSVPTDTVGNMARANFTTLINNINNDYQYRSNPAEVTSKDAEMWRKSNYWGDTGYDYGWVYYTVVNHVNRTVEVELKIVMDAYDSNDRYTTITLSPYQTYSSSYYYDDVYFGYKTNFSYNAYVYDYTVK